MLLTLKKYWGMRRGHHRVGYSPRALNLSALFSSPQCFRYPLDNSQCTICVLAESTNFPESWNYHRTPPSCLSLRCVICAWTDTRVALEWVNRRTRQKAKCCSVWFQTGNSSKEQHASPNRKHG